MQVDPLDPHSYLLYVEVPRSEIVFLHALFEGYDGIALVKTLDTHPNVLCIMATLEGLPICQKLLATLSQEIQMRFLPRPADLMRSFEYLPSDS